VALCADVDALHSHCVFERELVVAGPERYRPRSDHALRRADGHEIGSVVPPVVHAADHQGAVWVPIDEGYDYLHPDTGGEHRARVPLTRPDLAHTDPAAVVSAEVV